MSRATAWVGWIWFAALLIMASGVLNVMTGLVAVLGRDNAYVDTGVGLVVFDVESWGWVHLIYGVILVLVGACLAAGQTWARVLAIVLVTLNLLTQFITLPAYPVWSIIVIAIYLIVIWALIVHGDEVRDI
ncbi:hypothetical protein SAMN05216410_1448 [Sanguibacter gelidistatuariae]|uniref:DUF7144 domain-containing protein n=1 Tax=Sanguibacter gelidistatuariae TaxID=1814289 RepID=A0A1G6JYG8_9MICO|nr:hypothetical protein [Sanguibacter gelidistatuariae]SDC23757.1 hypothetical protein SAMN05216410_1448 [Sanguibacter gelidistatuariae]